MSQVSRTDAAAPVTAAYQPAAPSAPATYNGQTFAQLLSDSLEQEMVQQTITMTTPGAGAETAAFSQSAGGIQQMILTAAATGEAGDVEIALMMLCLMMQESESQELSSLMSAMAAMLTQVDAKAKSQAREAMLGSEYEPYVLATVDGELFAEYGVTVQGGQAVLPEQAWKAATPALTGSAQGRSPQALRAVIDQFDVENSQRYQPYRRGGDTYCNIFLWDVTSALGCEIPHYVDKETGAPRSYPDVKGAVELGANATYDWLASSGGQYGWREVSAREAQDWANQGGVAVTAWKNPSGGSGHVQVVCPSREAGYDELRGVTVAQAGANNSAYTHLSATFRQSQIKDVRYYAHV